MSFLIFIAKILFFLLYLQKNNRLNFLAKLLMINDILSVKFGIVSKNVVYLQKIKALNMSKDELRSYRLNSMEEPSDEMLEAIMLGVQESARQSTIRAKKELERRFNEMVKQMEQFRTSQKRNGAYA